MSEDRYGMAMILYSARITEPSGKGELVGNRGEVDLVR
jgi:hypothetical protein